MGLNSWYTKNLFLVSVTKSCKTILFIYIFLQTMFCRDKYTSFSPFLGRTGGPIEQTLLSGGVQNPPSKQLTNFEILKIKTRGVITQRETNKFRT